MALADWLNPATPQPTYLTSRAMGVVVPEYFKAAAEARKTALGLAGQEQTLRLSEEEAQRQRDAERRRQEEEAAAAAVMPGLTSLDPRSPTYFRDLTQQLSKPGAANALASRSVQSFLGIAGEARAESNRLDEEQRRREDQLAEERRREAAKRREETRAVARVTTEGAMRLAEDYAADLEDDTFLEKFAPKIAAAKTPEDRVNLVTELNKAYSQKNIENKLLGSGLVKPDDLAKYKEADGRYGQKARAKLGEIARTPSANTIYTRQVSQLTRELTDETTTQARKTAILEELRRLNEFGLPGDAGVADPGAMFLPGARATAPTTKAGAGKL